MKRQAILHTKMKKLCLRLGVPTYIGVGILESLWHLTAREAPLGDIGRLSDEDIAIAIDYKEDATVLMNILADCGWLDRSKVHRLTVHDWHEHADDTVKKYVARKSLTFASSSPDISRNVQTCPDISRLPVPVPVPEPEPAYTQEANLRVFPPPKKPVPADEEFLRAWERWPLKTHQDEACRAWLSVVDSPSREADIFAALPHFEVSDLWARGIYERMDRWLFRSGWNDRPPARASPGESKQDKITERIAGAVKEAAKQRESRRDSHPAG